MAPYTATKFAMNGFFGALQNELALKKSSVSVSILILGLIDTESAMNKIRLVFCYNTPLQTKNYDFGFFFFLSLDYQKCFIQPQ